MRTKRVVATISLWRSQLDSKLGIGNCARVVARWQWKTKVTEWEGRCKSSQVGTVSPCSRKEYKRRGSKKKRGWLVNGIVDKVVGVGKQTSGYSKQIVERRSPGELGP